MTSFKASTHAGLNSDAVNTTPLDDETLKACWLCHFNGNEPTEADHNSFTAANTTKCEDVACHGNTSSDLHIGSHSPDANTRYVKTSAAITCSFCHSRTDVLIYNSTDPGNSGNINMSTGSGTTPAHFIKNITDTASDNHIAIDSVGWGTGYQGCVYCHTTDSGTVFNAINVSLKASHSTVGTNCYCHIVGTTTLHDLGVISVSGGGPDCIDCHGTGGIFEDVNETAMNQGIHANLNNQTPISNGSWNSLNKACWACHANGSEPSGHVNDILGPGVPANTTRPLNCSAGPCHVDGIPKDNTISGTQPKNTIEHVPDINTVTSIFTKGAINCVYCHKKDITPHIEPTRGSANETDASNISHYGDNANLITPTSNCEICHKDTTNASIWGNPPQVRHPVNKSIDFCRNCHGSGDTFHNETISSAAAIHYGFDWEDDGLDYVVKLNQQFQNNEGCFACHLESTTMEFIADNNTKICEECHYNGSTGPYSNKITLRSDIDNTVQVVFNHINDSSSTIVVPDMSQLYNSDTNITQPSSCYAYNFTTDAGACHGVSKSNNSSGYYAFYRKWSGSDNSMRPYKWTQTIDRLPNTSDCRICHLGINSTSGILADSPYWGNPMNSSSTKPNVNAHINASAKASDCWGCHVNGGGQPVDFHDANVTAGGGPDCISCHDVNLALATSLVDVSAINSSSAIHNGINPGTGGSTGN
ncbi:MAG: hypothetical protein M8353_11480, partial [ANME-2 cluster archaeon]|nr:hypothetical protein [ANME-2 cluster archaeon]